MPRNRFSLSFLYMVFSKADLWPVNRRIKGDFPQMQLLLDWGICSFSWATWFFVILQFYNDLSIPPALKVFCSVVCLKSIELNWNESKCWIECDWKWIFRALSWEWCQIPCQPPLTQIDAETDQIGNNSSSFFSSFSSSFFSSFFSSFSSFFFFSHCCSECSD